jgi:presequence protease
MRVSNTFVDKNNPGLKEGDTLHGFKILQVKHLPKISNVFYQLEHEKTKARYVHLSNDDTNNCFSVAFLTTPKDSTGVAHILEHTALCGSKRYPVRDPFFSMIRRSLNTFMNAFTSSDWTMYPFSSQDRTDFYNLLGIYLDAAFFPELKEINFSQEGHRLELKDSSDLDSPLEYKGIVYNEMKGAMSTPDRRLLYELAKETFPTITYHHNSGGDPIAIPDLTYQQFVDFHSTHYHPSNAYFYTYGTLPLDEHLNQINELVLSKFEAIDPGTKVSDEQRLTAPVKVDRYYPISEDEDDGEKCQVALSWLNCRNYEMEEVISLKLINSILLGSAGAPLQKALLESRLGKGLINYYGYDFEPRESYFFVGLEGVKNENCDKVEQLIVDTLEQVVKNGISQEEIDTAIHQLEISTLEISGGHYPNALTLEFEFIGSWLHGDDPLAGLEFSKHIDTIKRRVSEGPYLEEQIKRYLLNNPHRVTVNLKPDHTMSSKDEEDEKRRLAEIKSKMSQDDLNGLIELGKKLKEHQEQKEDLSVLPKIEVSDLALKERQFDPAVAKESIQGVKTTMFERSLNGLNYVKLLFSLDHLSLEERQWVPLLASLMTQSGAAGMNYEDIGRRMARYTSGISASVDLKSKVDQMGSGHDFLEFTTSALEENLDQMVDLLADLVVRWDFTDKERTEILINKRTAKWRNSIAGSGHQFAALAASRTFSSNCERDEAYFGIGQLHFMERLTKKSEQLGETIEYLNSLAQKILQQENLSVVTVSASNQVELIKGSLGRLIGLLPKSDSQVEAHPLSHPKVEHLIEANVLTTPVSYVSQIVKCVGYTHPDAPKLKVLNKIIGQHYLHTEIREKGGAYGGMSRFSPINGLFAMLSYRDPHLARTVDIFKQTLKWLDECELGQDEVDESIVSVISELDMPSSPYGEAYRICHEEISGLTLEVKQKFRDGVLAAKWSDLKEVAHKYLVGQASIAAVTSQEIIDRDSCQEFAISKV